MKLKNSSVVLLLFLFLVLFSTIVSAQFTIGDSINVSSCMDVVLDIAVIEQSMFAWGETSPGGVDKVALIDISNPLAMTLETCLNLGSIGTPRTINIIDSRTSGVDYFLLVAFQSGGGDGLVIVNVTGTTLTEDFTYAVGSGAFEFRRGTMLASDDASFWGCDVSNAKTYSVYNAQGAQTLLETNSGLGGGLCVGVTDAFGNPSDPVFAIPIKADRTVLQLLSSGNEIDNTTYGVSGTSQGVDCIEQEGDTVILACNGMNVLTVTGNAFVEGDGINMGGGVQTTGLAFTTSDTVILVGRNATNNEGHLYAYNISDRGSVERLDTLFNLSPMTSIGSVEYIYPYSYVSFNRALLYSIGFIPPELNASNNVKPRITSIDAPTLAGIGDTPVFNYNVANPETASFGQSIITGLSCDYTETLVHEDNFSVAPNNCGIVNVGVIKNFDYGTALNISNCTGQHILTPDTSVTDNTIISFDLKMSEDSETSIDIMSVSFSVITTLDFSVNNSLLSVSSQGTVILDNINISSASTGSVPTRFYVLLKPGENNNLHMATNYRLFNTEIDRVFCDGTEFCYIGNEPFASLSDFSNVYGLVVNGGATTIGDVLIDNLKIVGVDNPPNLGTTTDLSVSLTCSYNRTGIINTRIYASDTTTGTNYLYYESRNVTVIETPLANQTTQIVNSSLTQALRDVMSIAGGTSNDDLALIAFIVILGSIAGIIVASYDTNILGGVAAGGLVGMLEATLAWQLQFFGLGTMVIVFLICAAILSLSLMKMFSGGGG